MTMGVSLESRVPFLDHRFVELAMSIPQAVKTRNDRLKSVLKDAVRGVIPDELIDRPKQGFGVPVHEWLQQGLGERIRGDLARFCRDTDLLNRDAVMRVVDAGDAPRAWYLLNLALWHREYIG
jgi:asparagine synthase (glutamine-hydrolysing)